MNFFLYRDITLRREPKEANQGNSIYYPSELGALSLIVHIDDVWDFSLGTSVSKVRISAGLWSFA